MVKKALTEHLDMDPRVTLGVLCDQIIPPEEPMDEEEQAIRDRLRSLVLSFLTGEAKRAIVERHAVPGSTAEDVLVSCLLEVSYHNFPPFRNYHNVAGDPKIVARRRRNNRQKPSPLLDCIQAWIISWRRFTSNPPRPNCIVPSIR